MAGSAFALAAGCCLVPAAARGAEHAAGLVTAPMVAAIRAEEQVLALTAVQASFCRWSWLTISSPGRT
jgi:hypothetical protein